MRLADLVAVSRAVTETSGRLEKIGHLADLAQARPAGRNLHRHSISERLARQGRIGIGWALFRRCATFRPPIRRRSSSRRRRRVRRIAGTIGRRIDAAPAGTLRELLRPRPPRGAGLPHHGCSSASFDRARSKACWSKRSRERRTFRPHACAARRCWQATWRRWHVPHSSKASAASRLSGPPFSAGAADAR